MAHSEQRAEVLSADYVREIGNRMVYVQKDGTRWQLTQEETRELCVSHEQLRRDLAEARATRDKTAELARSERDALLARVVELEQLAASREQVADTLQANFLDTHGKLIESESKRHALAAEMREATRLLRMVEWVGYDSAGGERACPCCMAWAYQGDDKTRQHGYACAIAAFLARSESTEGTARPLAEKAGNPSSVAPSVVNDGRPDARSGTDARVSSQTAGENPAPSKCDYCGGAGRLLGRSFSSVCTQCAGTGFAQNSGGG